MEDLLAKVIMGIGAAIFSGFGFFGIFKFLLRRTIIEYDNKLRIIFEFKDLIDKEFPKVINDMEWIKKIMDKIEIKMGKTGD